MRGEEFLVVAQKNLRGRRVKSPMKKDMITEIRMIGIRGLGK